ncbi:MAG: hypothetical protein LQ342_003173 [Letrouitia transgressa]|nr:MAG: hypothetical protein LQ342_003173 [Letrouitia transgressa]
MDIPKSTSSDQLEDPFIISPSHKWGSPAYGHAPRNLDQAAPVTIENYSPNKIIPAISRPDGLSQDTTGGVTTSKPQISSMATSNEPQSSKLSADSISSQLRAAAVPFRPASEQKTQPLRSVSEKLVFRDSFETPQREINYGENPLNFHGRFSKIEANHLRREKSEPEMTPSEQRAYSLASRSPQWTGTLPPTPLTQTKPNSSRQRRRKKAQTDESLHSHKSMFLSGFYGNFPSVTDSRGYFTAPVRSESFSNENNGNVSQASFFDQYSSPTPSISASSHQTPQQQLNPYAQETNDLGSTTFYQGSGSYPQQLQYHLYAALGPHRDDSPSNQRTARDFFIPEDLRQSLFKKTEASLMTIPSSTLPPSIAHFHSLVPLVSNNQKNATLFGYLSWAYKAMSANDGKFYCLRRLQGYRLMNETVSEQAVRSIQQNWKRVRNGNVVTVHLAFTNGKFGDSSLIFVTDFHPASETLAQKHLPPPTRHPSRFTPAHVPEQVLWGYIVQIANGLKAIHAAGLVARVLDPSKILLTGENRIRLNGCAILDVTRADSIDAIADLQRLDLQLFGKLIFTLGTNTVSTQSHANATDIFTRSYSPRLKEKVNWLLEHGLPHRNEGIDVFVAQIATEVISVFDSSLHQDDALQTHLTRELENSRIVRLLTKLQFINERPEYEHDRSYSEHGNRAILPLFRDYVFHQVDAQGNPVLDLAHVLSCLNKLDTGIEEKIMLTTRDETNVIVASYKEVKVCVEGAWQDLVRRAA